MVTSLPETSLAQTITLNLPRTRTIMFINSVAITRKKTHYNHRVGSVLKSFEQRLLHSKATKLLEE